MHINTIEKIYRPAIQSPIASIKSRITHLLLNDIQTLRKMAL